MRHRLLPMHKEYERKEVYQVRFVIPRKAVYSMRIFQSRSIFY